MSFCDLHQPHNWHVDTTHFTPPKNTCIDMKNVPLDVKEQFVRARKEGITLVYLRCSDCGTGKVNLVYGKYERTQDGMV